MHDTYPFVLEPLNYSCNALEPYMNAQTIEVHFTRYLKKYIDNLNDILEHYPELQFWSLEQLLYNYQLLPCAVQESIKNNSGGVYNHYLYFDCMSPLGTTQMNNEFAIILKKEFGSIMRLKNLYITAATKLFGSGYVWLVLNAKGDLAVVTTKNQDNPLSFGLYPLLTLDLWEHAYYNPYFNDRKQYAENWFYLINWEYVFERYQQFKNLSLNIR